MRRICFSTPYEVVTREQACKEQMEIDDLIGIKIHSYVRSRKKSGTYLVFDINADTVTDEQLLVLELKYIRDN